MGATNWFHEVPWQPNVQVVLDELCAGIFAAGSYRQLWQEYPEMLDSWRDMLEGSEPLPGLLESIDEIRSGSEPASIESAEWLNQGEGFGDVLDCRIVSGVYTYGTVSLLPDPVTFDLFGTSQPNCVQIRVARETLLELPGLERGYGFYIVGVGAAANPESIFFFGHSGD
jgi:hypothetical protein